MLPFSKSAQENGLDRREAAEYWFHREKVPLAPLTEKLLIGTSFTVAGRAGATESRWFGSALQGSADRKKPLILRTARVN